ncbi:MAG: HAD-IG family 5'-nucleotidase [Myxococcota bacterium]|jgi:HAD superfamily 5'-nucleotidase-like hydrolase
MISDFDIDLPEIPEERRIFVNRNLRLNSIEAVGFDMDYTLALYMTPSIDRLAYRMTVDRLINSKGYPKELAALEFDPMLAQRGLVVDKPMGNVIKMDQFNHVWRVRHGTTELPRDQATELYRRRPINYATPRFAWMDTLYSMPETSMFMSLVDAEGLMIPYLGRDYQRIFDDIRECTDGIHRDGTLKKEILRDPALYILKDPALADTLHRFRSVGKKLFLLTNSMWGYTNGVMSFLLGSDKREYPTWTSYFELVVVGGSKPDFFTKARPFYRLDTSKSFDGEAIELAADGFERGVVYQGGNIRDFERISGLSGDSILYVGDHIHGDILRSKMSSRWRTCMIIPELESEMKIMRSMEREISELKMMEEERNEFENRSIRLKLLHSEIEDRMKVAKGVELEDLHEAHSHFRHSLEAAHHSLKELTTKSRSLEREIEAGYSDLWGSLFREKNENTKFAAQVELYACLYTSRVTNFNYYSPKFYFISPRTLLPHEL